jgi:methylamine dehydrogenase accessory protein MauD
MDGPWLIAFLALWALTLLLAAVVLAHSRLLGLLHHRLGPASAKFLDDGPKLGATLSGLEGRTLEGEPWAHRFPSARPALVVFVSPQCQSCNALLPHVKDFVRTQGDLDLLVISTLDDLAMNRAYVAYLGLHQLTYVVGPKLAETLQVQGTPYALALDEGGVVRNKGVVNNYEHLLSLRRPRLPAVSAGPTNGPVPEPSAKGQPDEAPEMVR